jgi:hypothetical protein
MGRHVAWFTCPVARLAPKAIHHGPGPAAEASTSPKFFATFGFPITSPDGSHFRVWATLLLYRATDAKGPASLWAGYGWTHRSIKIRDPFRWDLAVSGGGFERRFCRQRDRLPKTTVSRKANRNRTRSAVKDQLINENCLLKHVSENCNGVDQHQRQHAHALPLRQSSAGTARSLITTEHRRLRRAQRAAG